MFKMMIKGHLKKLQGRSIHRWNKPIADDELDYREGCYLIPGKLQKRFSYSEDRINKAILSFIERSKWR